MDSRVKKVLELIHKHFEDEDKQYSEYESSDVEYFVGCMLYNHFAFSKALENLKTMDLSYDFLSSFRDEEYAEIEKIVESIDFEKEEEKLLFLENYISKAKDKYSASELYLLNRIDGHVKALKGIYDGSIIPQKVVFKK
ncbi:MAG: hypothetical protein OQK11_11150 [Thiovulaceae bacterium]|nr:hypothetical protein [Sulfurimonadaceae bacterium]